MGEFKRHWIALIAILIVTFSLLGWGGVEIYRTTPPIPEKFVDRTGQVVMTKDDILNGQSAWQSTGGMQLGSVYGHGALQAPDWTADFLHRELTTWMDIKAQAQFQKPFAQLTVEQQAPIESALKQEYRKGSAYNNGTVTLSDTRIAAMQQTAKYYIDLYGDSPEFHKSRESFAMKENTLPDLSKREHLQTFIFGPLGPLLQNAQAPMPLIPITGLMSR